MNEHITKPIDRALLYKRLQYWFLHRLNADGSRSLCPADLRNISPDKLMIKTADQYCQAAEALSDMEKLQSLSGVAGLDIQDGLARLGNKAALYWLVMEQLACTEQDNPARIRAALATGDIETASRTAHSLKGAAANLSVRDLTRLAAATEALLREPPGAELEQVLDQLEQTMHSFCQALQQINRPRL